MRESFHEKAFRLTNKAFFCILSLVLYANTLSKYRFKLLKQKRSKIVFLQAAVTRYISG